MLQTPQGSSLFVRLLSFPGAHQGHHPSLPPGVYLILPKRSQLCGGLSPVRL